MSSSLLQKVANQIGEFTGVNDWYKYYFATITDTGDYQLEGYDTLFYKWFDDQQDSKTPFIMFRQVGEGSSDIDLQSTDVMITLVGLPDTVKQDDDTMSDIVRVFRTTRTQSDVVRFDPVGGVIGPRYLENGRPVFMLTVRCWTENL